MSQETLVLQVLLYILAEDQNGAQLFDISPIIMLLKQKNNLTERNTLVYGSIFEDSKILPLVYGLILRG